MMDGWMADEYVGDGVNIDPRKWGPDSEEYDKNLCVTTKSQLTTCTFAILMKHYNARYLTIIINTKKKIFP